MHPKTTRVVRVMPIQTCDALPIMLKIFQIRRDANQSLGLGRAPGDLIRLETLEGGFLVLRFFEPAARSVGLRQFQMSGLVRGLENQDFLEIRNRLTGLLAEKVEV